MKSGVVTIVGRPSSGKSTLMNKICGHKISIVSPLPQTTRRAVRGILTEARGQIVFLDTPGYHTSLKKMNNYLKEAAEEALKDTDAILYILDAARKPGEEEAAVVKLVTPYKAKTLAVINKIDKKEADPGLCGKYLDKHLPEIPIINVSALTGEGCEDLLTVLFEFLPEDHPLYPEDFYTDQEPSFRIEEIIREQAILRTREEVPHGLYVEVADLELSEDEKSLWARVFLTVEKESQKGILIGKGGKMIKAIRVESEKLCKSVFPYKVSIDLRVKVDPKWKSRDPLLKRITKG